MQYKCSIFEKAFSPHLFTADLNAIRICQFRGETLLYEGEDKNDLLVAPRPILQATTGLMAMSIYLQTSQPVSA